MNIITSAIEEHIRKGDIVISFGALGGILFGKLDGFYYPQLFDIAIGPIGLGHVLSVMFKLISVMIFGGVGALGGAVVKDLYPKVKDMIVSRASKINNSHKTKKK